ncbi:uncharacterized protein A4U43_C02F9490 [Asparagus officinalis]|uniref:Uncharacterized protein n=1 Tax=Asparagus officinalis TaxID=4686 RepID=A0A5P1FH93_ASPOF|nr:uncharacterized protein A4U43_C02F9490 [Asparagus officinalis]
MPPVLLLLSLLGLLSLTKLTLSSLYYAYAFFLRAAKTQGPLRLMPAIRHRPTQGTSVAPCLRTRPPRSSLILIGASRNCCGLDVGVLALTRRALEPARQVLRLKRG